MTYIYAYRLTHFGGTAPCFDNCLLTLAICKRDMRRVIGNLYTSKSFDQKNDEIWFLGIIDKGLAKNKKFEAYEDKVIYAAKVTDVKEYHEYFTDCKFEKRADVIYKKTNGKTKLKSGNEYFEHRGSDIHNTQNLQERDFDTAHKNSKKYVLLSKCYCFMNPDDNESIKTIICNKGKWPAGVGHRWFEDEQNKLSQILEQSAKCSDAVNCLPKEIKTIITKNQGCGKKE